jgi:threonine dehydrogenase-like Zn-dependent dehydrogenase
MKLTGGEGDKGNGNDEGEGGVDVVFDSVGLVGDSIRCLKWKGRVLVVGFAGREGDLERVAVNRVLLRQVQVIGYVSPHPSYSYSLPLSLVLPYCYCGSCCAGIDEVVNSDLERQVD